VSDDVIEAEAQALADAYPELDACTPPSPTSRHRHRPGEVE
jgi:hypothetical protein